MKQQVKAVIFDWGNVLGRFDKDKVHRRLCQFSLRFNTPQDVARALGAVDGLTTSIETGLITEVKLFEIVSQTLSLQNIEFGFFRGIWGNMMSPNGGVDCVIRRIRPDVKKFVLSNSESIHWSYIEQLPVMKEFFSDPDVLVRSYVVGARKPDERIFREGIHRTGLEPSQILYIDDILEYTQVFQRLGAKYWFTTALLTQFPSSKNTSLR